MSAREHGEPNQSEATKAAASKVASPRESVGMRRRREHALRIAATLGPAPLIVGLDLASQSHVAWVRTAAQQCIASFEVRHSLEGIEKLRHELEPLVAEHGCERIVVGMEPTSHYWKNMFAAFEPTAMRCVLVSTVSVFHDRKAKHLRRAKGDRRDAEIIAGLVARGDFLRTTLETDPRAIRMRILADEHEDLVDLAGSERQRIRAGLGLVLPELLEVFDDPLGETSRALLRALGLPEPDSALTQQRLLERLGSLVLRSREGRRVYPSKVNALAARLRCGPSFGVESHRAATLGRIGRGVARHEQLDRDRVEIAEKLVALYEELPFARFLDTIPHVGPLQHALVVAYVGDPRRFDRASCLVSCAGTEPQENQSGESAGPTLISRAGPGRLREIVYRIAMGLTLHSSHHRAVLERLRARALAYRQALVVIGNKYLRLLYRLAVEGKPFDVARLEGHRVRSCRKTRTGAERK